MASGSVIHQFLSWGVRVQALIQTERHSKCQFKQGKLSERQGSPATLKRWQWPTQVEKGYGCQSDLYSLLLLLFLCLLLVPLFPWWDCLTGLVVKASALRAKDPGFESRLWQDFSGLSHTSDSKIDTPVVTLPGAWRYRISTGTGWPGVSILWLGEVESLICNFSVWQHYNCLSRSVPEILTCCWEVKQLTNKQTPAGTLEWPHLWDFCMCDCFLFPSNRYSIFRNYAYWACYCSLYSFIWGIKVRIFEIYLQVCMCVQREPHLYFHHKDMG